jgi:hypothetical protein
LIHVHGFAESLVSLLGAHLQLNEVLKNKKRNSLHGMHHASFALGTWKRVASKQGQWLNPKFVFAILCSFSSEYNLKRYLK